MNYIENKNKKTNISNLIKNLGNDFLKIILYEKETKQNMEKIKNLVFDLINTKVNIEDFRWNNRCRTRPYTEYSKSGFKNYNSSIT